MGVSVGSNDIQRLDVLLVEPFVVVHITITEWAEAEQEPPTVGLLS